MTCAGVSLALVGVSACSSETSDASPSEAVQSATDPSTIEAGEKIVYVSNNAYPPYSFEDENGDLTGVEVDLAWAALEAAGFDPEVKGAAFDGILPGIQAGKYEVSFFNDTKERQEIFSFVDMFDSGTTIMVGSENPNNLSIDNLCGEATIAVEKGSQQQSVVGPDLQQACEDNGETPFKLDVYPSGQDAILAIDSGRADAMLAETAQIAYIVSQNEGKYVVPDGDQIALHPVGFGVLKDSGLAEAILKGGQAIMDSGEYDKILEKWGMQATAKSAPIINGAKE
jgi:polar amino acid transport system substrate-binding protein